MKHVITNIIDIELIVVKYKGMLWVELYVPKRYAEVLLTPRTCECDVMLEIWSSHL